MSSVLPSFVLRSQRTLLASTLLLSIPLLKRLWSLLSSPRRIRDSRSSEHWTAAATKASAKDLTKAELNSVGTSAALTETSVVTAELSGFYPATSASHVIQDSRWLTTWKVRDFLRFLGNGHVIETFRTIRQGYAKTRLRVGDARQLQRQEMEEQGMSAPDFFAKHGFILLKHQTAMTEEDWLASVENIESFFDADVAVRDERYMSSDTPARRIWSKEAESILKSVIPGAASLELPSQGVRRESTMGRFSGKGAVSLVHNDLPLDVDQACEKASRLAPRMRQQREQLQGPDGYKSLLLCNLWRPIAPCKKVQAMPLCLCDASSIAPEDFVELQIAPDEPGSLQITGLKYNPRQRWFYYPAMETDEVLVFRQFERAKGDSAPPVMPTFHTAFCDPTAPANAEPRISFEYRVSMLTR